MTTAPDGSIDFSPSSVTAMRWAAVAAAHRQGNEVDPSQPQIRGGDVLLGVLLSHPDVDGEARVLLQHFGLTARDVLPPDYPSITEDKLRSLAGRISSGVPPLEGEASFIVTTAQDLARGKVRLAHLLGGLLLAPQTELVSGLETALARSGSGLPTVRESYARWLSTYDEGSDHPAGKGLRDWLEEENKRDRIDVAGFAPDAIDATHDLIGVRLEADALAYLIASRDVRPPLAIGLFGDWGSGKSFLMRSIQQRIRTMGSMVAQAPQATTPIWRNIKQIEFNAWEYTEGNLWAGLLERIFRELGTLPMPSIVEDRRQPVRVDLEKQKAIVEKANRDIGELEVERGRREEALREAEQNAESARKAAEGASEEVVTARGTALKALRRLWSEEQVAVVGEDGADLLNALRAARAEMQRGPALRGPYWTRTHILLVSLGALLVPLIAFVLSVVASLPPVVTVLAALAPLVPLATTALRNATRWTATVLSEIETAEAEIRSISQVVVDDAIRQVDDAQRGLAEVEQQLADAALVKQQAIETQTVLDETLNALTTARILVDFADQRSSDYRQRLGLLATVRRDLEKLQIAVVDNNKAASIVDAAADATDMPNRIVLYIDDLDRCRPAKVIEVLEAVHLLLAFELFVAVVAVDSRWLSSALTDQLIVFRSMDGAEDRPTTHDYLEKIFQLPFWVRPLPVRARAQLVQGLLATSVRSEGRGDRQPDNGRLTVGEQEMELLAVMLSAPGAELRLETSPLTLSTDDLRFIESLAPLLGDTPRRVKRFVNTCQLLLAMPPRLTRDPGSPSRREIVCLLAAVAEGLPAVAAQLFPCIRSTPAGTLSQWCVGCEDLPDARRLKAWLDEHPVWSALSLQRLDERLDMVDRLGFAPPRLEG